MKRFTLITAWLALAVVMFFTYDAEAGGFFRRRVVVNEQPQEQSTNYQRGSFAQYQVGSQVQINTPSGPTWVQLGPDGMWYPVQQAAPQPQAQAQQQAPQRQAAPAIKWGSDYDGAINAGITEDKTVVIFFTAKTCVHCPRQESNFADPRVVAAMANAVAVKVSTDDRADLAEEYKVTTVPAVAFVSPDGKANTFEGVQSAETLLAKLGPKQARRK